MMFVYIKCSNCGGTRRLSDKFPINAAADTIDKGWRSRGMALYCPKCSKTWWERNTVPMSNGVNTMMMILDHIASAQFRRKYDGA